MLHEILLVMLTTVTLLAAPRVLATGEASREIKANVSALAGVPGVAYEVSVTDRTSFSVDVTASLWRSINNAPYLYVMVLPEWRVYSRSSRQGYYVGAHTGITAYRIQKWNYRGTQRYQEGFSTLLGVTVGHKRNIGDRWMLDAFVGGGNQSGKYRGYDGATGEQYTGQDGWDRSREWLPYRAGIMIGYRLRP